MGVRRVGAMARLGLVLLMLVCNVGCAGRQGLPPAAGQPPGGLDNAQSGLPRQDPAVLPAWQLQGVPALPVDAPVDAALIRARRAEAVGTLGLLGSQAKVFEPNSAHIDPAEQSCVLSSEPGQLSWAMYAFPDLLPEDIPLALSLQPLGETPPSPCYIAASNYTKGAWDWTALSEGQQQFNIGIGAGAGSLSPSGSLYVLVATWDAVSLAIGSLGLELDCPNPPPDGFDIEPGNGVDLAVHLSWVDPAISYDPDGDGPDQFSFDGVLVQSTADPAGTWDDLAQLPVGTTSFDDPNTLGSQGGTVYYRLMTLITGVPIKPGFVLPGNITLTIYQLVAKLTSNPAYGSPGVSVAFNASGSTRVGGPFKSVQWDYEGDGVWDYSTVATLTTSHVYPTAGRYYPRVKLTMDIGGGKTMTDAVAGYLAVGDKRGDWSQLGRNSQHTSCSPLRGPTTPTLRGSYTASKAFSSPVVGADGTVYAACRDGYLRAFNPSCAMLRQVNVGGTDLSVPAIDRNGYIWIYELAIGDQFCVWPDFTVHEFPWNYLSGEPVVGADGVNLYLAGEFRVYQCTPFPAPGVPEWYNWYWSIPTPNAGTLAVAPDGAAFVAGGHSFYRLSPAGKQVWQIVDVFYPHDPAQGADGRIYMRASYSAPIPDALLCYGSDASFKWQANLAAGEYSVGAPAIAGNGNIYISTNKGRVYGFTSAGGKLSPPAYEGGVGFVSPPAIDADGVLFLLTTDGHVISLTRKLFLRWSYDLGVATGAVQSSLAIGNDGTLYIGGTNKLVALK